jgi:cytidylate kinase
MRVNLIPMGNTLLTYLNKRVYQANQTGLPDKQPGPVITISREVGCSGLELAHVLKERLACIHHQDNWKVLSKEIFQVCAGELDIEPDKVAKIFKHFDRNAFDDILYSFREKSSISEKKVRNTVIDVIRSFAEDGHCIIVGRAGNIISADIKNSLHLRLVAPHEFRVQSIMVKNKLNHDDAVKFIALEEKDRLAYRHALIDKKIDHPEIFDITINRAEFDTESIVGLVLHVMEKRGMLTHQTARIGYF